MRQISAASGKVIQLYATLNNRNQSLHDVDGQGKSDASNNLLPRIRREKDVAPSLCERSG